MSGKRLLLLGFMVLMVLTFNGCGSKLDNEVGPTIQNPTSPQDATNPETLSAKITFIHYDGAGTAEPDEYVEFKNTGTTTITLTGWTLRDKASHIYHFPSGYQMAKGKVCRVYTNQIHSTTCGFDYHSKSAIWNNDGDTATLKSNSGVIMSKYTY